LFVKSKVKENLLVVWLPRKKESSQKYTKTPFCFNCWYICKRQIKHNTSTRNIWIYFNENDWLLALNNFTTFSSSGHTMFYACCRLYLNRTPYSSTVVFSFSYIHSHQLQIKTEMLRNARRVINKYEQRVDTLSLHKTSAGGSTTKPE
jgi:hypothetical protein